MSFKYIRRAAFVAGLLFASATLDVSAQPTPGQTASGSVATFLPFVSPIFGDNMVLQRGKLDTIWGWSDPGDTVRVQFGTSTATGTDGPDRRWVVRIQPSDRRPLHFNDHRPSNRRVAQCSRWRCLAMRWPIEHGAAY